MSLLRTVLASDVVDRLFTPHGVDRYLELIDPSWTVRTPPVSPAPNDVATANAEALAGTDAIHIDDGALTFARSGVVAPSVGTVLETAEAAGLSPAFGCRRGICRTCTATKTSGQVRNTITGERSVTETAPIRPCVSVACGDVTVEL